MRNKTHRFLFYFTKPMNKKTGRKAKYILLCFVLNAISHCSFSQDLEMSQYFSAPLQLNPALAGISYGPRVTINYRNQWSALGDGFNGGYTTYMAGFDMHVDALKAGIGALFTADRLPITFTAPIRQALFIRNK